MSYNYKSAKNALRGRQNRAEGNAFEEIIERSCAYYREKGIAHIEKTPEPFKVIGAPNNRGQFAGYFTKQAQPDFKGVLHGGRCIVFDAKCTSTDKIPTSALTDTQRDTLTQYKQLGAESGVLMCFKFAAYYYLPIDTFLNAKELNGHQWWTIQDCIRQTLPLPYNNKVYFIKE